MEAEAGSGTATACARTDARTSLRFDGSRVELIEEALPPLKEGEVRIRTECTNVSIGTEIAFIELNGRSGKPCGLGYSNVGVIEELGPGVSGLEVGRRVLTSGPHTSRFNAPARPVAPAPVPEGLAPVVATLAMLGSVACHIVERAAPRLMEPTAVIGQGVVGSLVLQWARLCGAEPLIAVDADRARLALARELGAHAIDASTEDAVARVRELTDGQGVSLCIEAAGTAAIFGPAMKMLRLRGRLVVSSTVFEPVPFLIHDDFIQRELSVVAAHQPKCPVEPNAYYPWTQTGNRRAAMQCMLDGRLKVDHLLSHRVRPGEAPGIYERLRRKDRGIVGVVIDWRA